MSRFSLSKMSFALLVGILLMLFGQSLFAAQANPHVGSCQPIAAYGVTKFITALLAESTRRPIDVKNVTSYQVTGLGDGTTYYFAVTAYNSSAESAFSDEVTYTTPPGTYQPAPVLYLFPFHPVAHPLAPPEEQAM